MGSQYVFEVLPKAVAEREALQFSKPGTIQGVGSLLLLFCKKQRRYPQEAQSKGPGTQMQHSAELKQQQIPRRTEALLVMTSSL